MNKKSLYFSFAILIVFVVVIFSLFFYVKNYRRNNDKKFKLESKYYNDNGLTDVSVKELEEIVKNKESFILFVYNDFCSFSVPCDTVFDKASKNMNLQILQISYRDYKKANIKKKIKYAPSVLIYIDGKVDKYLDAEKDEDKKRYQDEYAFRSWVSKNIYDEKKKN